MRLGFIGLGRMGANMVRRLCATATRSTSTTGRPRRRSEIEGEGEGAASFSIAELVV